MYTYKYIYMERYEVSVKCVYYNVLYDVDFVKKQVPKLIKLLYIYNIKGQIFERYDPIVLPN